MKNYQLLCGGAGGCNGLKSNHPQAYFEQLLDEKRRQKELAVQAKLKKYYS